jgi:hypothetical protein
VVGPCDCGAHADGEGRRPKRRLLNRDLLHCCRRCRSLRLWKRWDFLGSYGTRALTSQMRRTPAARAAPNPSLWRLNGPCAVALLVHEHRAPWCISVRAWGRPAARPLRRYGSRVQGGTWIMGSDSWRDLYTSSDLIGFSSLSQRMSLVQDPAPLLGRDSLSSEKACDAVLLTRKGRSPHTAQPRNAWRAGVMVLRFVLLYRGIEANVPGQSAHSAVGNKKG